MVDRRKKDDTEQSKRFIDTAKKLDSDKSGKQFERALASIASDTKKPKNIEKP
jgi:hypothetical protein